MIKKYLQFIKENIETESPVSEKPVYNPKNLIEEICVAMVLLNNSFLDNLLDKGMKARYSENSQVFLTDLKNLLLGKNRLKLGIYKDGRFVEDDDFGKVNSLFENVDFSIDKDWNELVNARTTGRNIIDKLIPDDKLTEDMIESIYWIGPNQTKDNKEDIVIELTDGKQYSFFLNKNLSTSKSASFNTFADDLIGVETEKMYSEEYLPKWNKLTQEWMKILYENANKNIQIHIDKFIDSARMDSLGYFEYFNITHRDPRYKHLGEHIREFDKNILYLSDLMSEIWKNREECFMDVESVYNSWMERKVYILNSKILEHLLTESLTKNNINDITKLRDGMKLADGNIKMKLVKTLVEKLGCYERTIYYLGSNGNVFYQLPPRQFFREYYDDLTVKFDYHVKMIVDPEEENNDFKIKIELELDGDKFIECDVLIKFSGGEMNSKLSAKYKFEFADDFNYKISTKSK